MRKYLFALIALLMACGAQDPQDDAGIGQDEQAFTTKETTGPGRILGVISGGCSPAGSGAVFNMTEACQVTVPSAVSTIVIGIDPPSDGARMRDALARATAGLNANMPGGFAHFSLLPSGIAGAHVVFFNDPSLHGPGGGVRAYNGMTSFGTAGVGFECSTAALIDTPAAGGTFRRFLSSGGAAGPQQECSMSLNITQIGTDFPTTAKRNIVAGNAAANALVELVGLGYGGHSNSFITAATDPLIDTTIEKFGIVPGQLCLLQHYAFANQNFWTESTASPCPDYPAGI